LNAELTACFIKALREAEPDLDEAIAALRETHRQMSGGFIPRRAGFERGAA